MKLSVIPDDNLIILDGHALSVDFNTIPVNISNIWAIHWDDANTPQGEVQFRDVTHNLPFDDPASLQPFVDAHAAKVAELAQPLPLAEYKAVHIAHLEIQAGNNITAGFNCAALGGLHHYGGKATDQINLIGAVSTGLDLPFPCADENDVWARRLHTAAQLQQVLNIGAAHKQEILVALDDVRDQVAAAVDHDSVDAIVWVEV
jgi:hypothetical protein